MPRPAAAEGPLQHVIRNFGGINTKESRAAIKDGEFYWLENFIPIGDGVLVPPPSYTMLSITLSSGNAVKMEYASIGSVGYIVILSDTGWLYFYNIVTNTIVSSSGGWTNTACVSWQSLYILVIDSANGYYYFNGSSVSLLNATIKGTTVAVYAGRVWIGNGLTVVFSAPNAYNDFTTVNAGGSFVLQDSDAGSITKLIAVNNYLYIIRSNSISAIGNVQVVSGTTYFSITPLADNTGTSYYQSIIKFEKSIIFSNSSGVFALVGSQVTKVSDPLDGVWSSLDPTTPIISFVSTIYANNYVSVLFRYIGGLFNSYSGSVANGHWYMAVLREGKWSIVSTYFNGSMPDVTNAVSVGQGGNYTVYAATPGAGGLEGFATLFSGVSQLNGTFYTKLMDFGDPITTKQLIRVGLEMQTLLASNVTIQGQSEYKVQDIKSLTTVIPAHDYPGGPVGIMVVGIGVVGYVQSSSFQLYGTLLVATDMVTYGKYIGFIVRFTAADPGHDALSVNGILLEYEKAARW